MKNKFLTIISLVLIIVLVINNGNGGIFGQNTAYAVGDLSVIWDIGIPEGDPIFTVTDFKPGDMEDRNVEVINGGTIPHKVGVKGSRTSETANLAGVLDFKISIGASDLYGGTTGSKTLQDFFNDSTNIDGIELTTVVNGNSANYTFKVTFPESAGNEYQEASVIFDITIGIITDLPAECLLINFTGPTIFGTSGNDNIQGTSKSEMIITFGGRDRVAAGGGDDCIVTGEGKDRVDGQTGDDVIDLGPGNDKSTPSGGSDIIYGGSGNDNINAGSGNDFVYGGEGKDRLRGGSGHDEVYGEQGDDKLWGGSGNDLLNGGADIDRANGGSGTDTCAETEKEIRCEIVI